MIESLEEAFKAVAQLPEDEQRHILAGKGMEGEEQSARSRSLPVPKEAREE